jgi:EAL domain-containing protein (putative c-di-GMP-specific phosphodiesterase class I)/AmiR/NasT family two-component response regulator
MTQGGKTAAVLLRTMLVLDDEAAVGRLIAEVAKGRGFIVEATLAPAIFEARFAAARPDVIVLDLVFPGGDGIEVMRFLESQRFQGSLILVSGMDDRVLTTARRLGTALGLNVIGALRKPFSPGALRELLDVAPAMTATGSDIGVRSALKNGEFVLHYQPVVDMRTTDLLGVEALVRWLHPKRGLLQPESFLPLVTSSDSMMPLTLWVLKTALDDAAGWRASGFDIRVSINAPASVLQDPDILHRIEAIRSALRELPSRLMIEVTETEAMGDPISMMEVLSRLRLAGVDLSIDDFGTGYSSLVELQRLPVSHLKIDKSFVLACLAEADAAAITRAVIELGHALGIQVVAEGVETLELWRQLSSWNCDAAQGFYVSRAIPAREIPNWARKWETAKGDRSTSPDSPRSRV